MVEDGYSINEEDARGDHDKDPDIRQRNLLHSEKSKKPHRCQDRHKKGGREVFLSGFVVEEVVDQKCNTQMDGIDEA